MDNFQTESNESANGHAREMDDVDRAIARELVKDPRTTDKHIRDATGIALRTVGRRRKRLEEEGLIRYSAEVDLRGRSSSHRGSRKLYIIRFRLEVSLNDVRAKVAKEPSIVENTDIIYESHIVEVDGRLALLIVIEGASEAAIVESVHDKLLPRLIKNHGEDAIEGISTICLLDTIRRQRNYLPSINMDGSTIKTDWPSSTLYVG